MGFSKHASILAPDCNCERSCAFQRPLLEVGKRVLDHPDYARLKAEFRGFSKHPHLLFETQGWGCGALANWQCGTCGHEWQISLDSRLGSKASGCSPCGSKRGGIKNVLSKANGGNDHYFISKALVVVDHPELDPRQLGKKSHLKLRWQCDCGVIFEKRMLDVAKVGIAACGACLNTCSSLFEYEVQAWLQALLPELTVLVHQNKLVYTKFVDIYVPELDLALELDPYRTHFKSHERDVRVLKELRRHYAAALRVRDAELAEIEGSVQVEHATKPSAAEWAKTIAQHSLLIPYVVEPAPIDVKRELAKANATWASRTAKPADALDLVAEAQIAFIENITRPGRRIDYTPRGSNDAASWQCLKEGCANIYPQRVYRWVDGVRCPKHKGEKIRRARRQGVGNANLKANYPQLRAELIGVLGQPEADLDQVSAWDLEMCKWRCPAYSHEYEAAPNSRMKGANCKVCLKLTGTAPHPEPIKRLDTTHPHLAAQFVRNITHPLRPLIGLSAASSDLCEWRCTADSNHQNWQYKVTKRTAGLSRGECPQCKLKKHSPRKESS